MHRWMFVFTEKIMGPKFEKNLTELKKKAEAPAP
jgi:hypothetical protein